ncbi:phosphoribosylformylglycinamidine synthase [Christensenellaceae bacterium]|nr:phosphoribosylformylglycinamidine synthase [Christensenellaceae bacterium]BDF62448.1 phosphoribosylformylglycinamidine synthase [Christensenellaceae bacterium]
MSVKRLFVEKKKGFDVEAQARKLDFKQNLGVPVTEVRILNRYDVEGIDDADFDAAVVSVFSEPAVDTVTYEEMPDKKGYSVFAVEYLPGQYDQRADSAAQCVQLLTRKERPNVRFAKIYFIKNVNKQQLETIKKYVINPVDSCEATLQKYDTLEMDLSIPTEVAVMDGFIKMNKKQVADFTAENGFAMTVEDMLCAQDYFKSEKRDPTITELKVLDTYWSDHCRHTTFSTALDKVEFADDPISREAEHVYEDYLDARRKMGREGDVCLMDLATAYVREAKRAGMLRNFDDSEEINACSIKQRIETDKGDRDYLIMFKNETHNHPTEIEPFGGAATCLGGAIRDPLSGRSYVYQAMRVTGSADPRESLKDTMEFKLPQRKITREAAHGYSSYGNQIGLATGLVEEVYHEGYKAKRLEIGAVIASAPAEQVIRERPVEGDLIVLIGGRTGRDGCGGATGSSKAHDEKSIEKCGAEVQKGNPLTERKLQRLFRNGEFSKMVKRCNDFGAGGVCVAIGELAEGLDIDLDAVPKKYEGLDGTELAISESQERMAVVVRPQDLDRVLALAAQENLEATLVARVTDTGRMRLFWNDKNIVDISREFLDTNGATQHAHARVEQFDTDGLFAEERKESVKDTLLSLLSDLNICSQKGLQEMFDSTIGAGSVTMPLGGVRQLSPVQAMCAKIPVDDADSKTATLMSYGLDPYMMSKSPFAGSVYAILLSVAKLVAAGGDMKEAWLTLQEYFERLHDDPQRWGKPLSALLGAYYAQRELGIAAIGGKDSMSGSFKNIDVPPTLCSFCVAPVAAKDVITPEFKQAGNKLYLMDIQRDENGLPDFGDVKRKYEKLHKMIQDKVVVSAYAVTRGGVLAGAAKCAFGNNLGVKLFSQHLERMTEKRYGAILVESPCIHDEDFEIKGEIREEPFLELMGETISLEDALKAYTQPLESVFATRTEDKGEVRTPLYKKKNIVVSRYKTAIPRVVIPVFPGTNCEYDTAKALETAGAIPRVVIMRNLSAQDIDESIRALESEIAHSQMIMLPGGFSGGDEPDGSGKFIATVFRNPRIKDATHELLKNKDGLILGICNGFQALIKLGLVPYGEIRDMTDDAPTLTYNNIGRHVSCMVRTRITSASSPWLMLCEPGEIHTVAVSHGEGRFVATEKEVRELLANGQVATQYVNFEGKPSMDIRYNPNGSMYAIEGIMSPDGRILGKMGHTERAGKYIAKNVPGEYDQKIFESGVKYFR